MWNSTSVSSLRISNQFLEQRNVTAGGKQGPRGVRVNCIVPDSSVLFVFFLFALDR